MSIRNQIKQALEALSAANAGEMLTRRDKHHLIGAAAVAPQQTVVPDRAHHSAVAICAATGFSERMFDYALDHCQRLKADLVLLTHEFSAATEVVLEEAVQKLRQQGVHARIAHLHGDWNQAMNHFMRSHRNILYLALSSRDERGVSLLGQGRRHRRHAFPVPLVVVDEMAA